MGIERLLFWRQKRLSLDKVIQLVENGLMTTDITKIKLPGKLEERYHNKPGEILLKYFYERMSLDRQVSGSKTNFAPHSVGNRLIPDGFYNEKSSKKLYMLLAKLSKREDFTKEDLAREIIGIYPWLAENLSKEALEIYGLDELIERIKQEFNLSISNKI